MKALNTTIYNLRTQAIKGLLCSMILVLAFSFPASALTITTNTWWTTSQTITGDLVIDNNATLEISGSALTSTILTVSGTIDIKPGSELHIDNNILVKVGDKIIVESANTLNGVSAQLIVDGVSCTLTALNTQWNGIEVWGNLSYGMQGSKATADLSYAVIEKAVTGVANYNPNIDGKKGGTIEAYDVTFKNNKTAVSIKENSTYYMTSQNGPAVAVPTNNASNFKECQFLLTTTDNPFYPSSATSFNLNDMVDIWDAKGISILGCTFNDGTGQGVTNGIRALNSDIRVGPSFIPISWNWGYGYLPNPTTFTHTNVAISASGPGTFNRILVQQANINDNHKGVQLNNEQNAVLINNIISQIGQSYNSNPHGLEILNGSSGITVESNQINGVNNEVTGIYVNNAGEANNEIYRNTIHNYKNGIFMEGVNGASYTSPNGLPTSQGLKIICNDLNNNNIVNSVGVTIGGTAAFYQGIPIANPNTSWSWKAAGNIFEPLSLHDPQFERLPNSDPFIYFCYPNNTPEFPGYNLNYNFTWSDYDNNCPVQQRPVIVPQSVPTILANIERQINQFNTLESPSRSDSIQLAGLIQWHQKLIDSALYTFMYNDSLEVRYDSMAWVLEQVHYDYTNQVRLAGVYLTQLRYADAINLLHNIHTEYTLNEDQITDLNNMADMYAVIDSLVHNGDDWNALTDNMRQEVYDVANQSGVYGTAVAIYLLQRYENYCYDPQVATATESFQTQSLNFDAAKAQKIYPNPTKGILYVDWKNNATAAFYNLKGAQILDMDLHKGLNELNIQHLDAGIYFVQIKENGQTVYRQKIIKK
ncbi:MAG TPA: T9SS type A sorting domain-containing protein [Edaphocola sp.]|nr:T9SS type A sorting domain-containing protein [Edaphocola sp.]